MVNTSRLSLLVVIVICIMGVPLGISPCQGGPRTWPIAVGAQYSVHPPIRIFSDADFASQGWPGSGTFVDPYVIEGLHITTPDAGIVIKDTSAYFVVRSCVFEGGDSPVSAGVYLENAHNGVVEDCLFLDLRFGVVVLLSTNHRVEACEFDYCYAAVSASGSSAVSIVDCRAQSCDTFVDASSTAIQVTRSSTSDVGVSVSAAVGSDLSISDSTFTEGGISIISNSMADWFIDVDNVTVNGLPLGYFANLTSGHIDASGYGQLILVNCTHVTASGGTFHAGNAIGIGLAFVSDSNLTDFEVYGGTNGIMMTHTELCRVTQCVLNGCESDGLMMYSGVGDIVYDTTFTDCLTGIDELSGAGNTIMQCFFECYYAGINVANSGFLNVSHNVFEVAGLNLQVGTITEHSLLTTNNTLNGKTLGVFSNQEGLSLDGDDYGQVILINCSHSVVDGGHFNGTNVAVIVARSEDCTVQNAQIEGMMSYGILGYSARALKVLSNNLSDVFGAAIYLDVAENSVIVNNTVTRCESTGLLISTSPNTLIQNNTISVEWGAAVFLGFSGGCTLRDDDLIGGGILLDGMGIDTVTFTVDDVTVNGSPLGYFLNEQDALVDGNKYGEVVLVNCTGVVVLGGEFAGTGPAVVAMYSKSCAVSGADFVDCWRGIHAQETNGFSVIDCRFIDCGIGLYFSSVTGLDILDNTVLDSVHTGIQISSCDNVQVTNNSICCSGAYGISVSGHSPLTVAHNKICGADIFGVYLRTSSDSFLLYDNEFAGNDFANAFDGDGAAKWNSSSVGNAWDDYSMIVPYRISTYYLAFDYHPRAFASDLSVDHPGDMAYMEGTTGHSIIWRPSCTCPETYSVYVDGELKVSDRWYGGLIEFSVDGLNAGSHNVTLVVQSACGASLSDTVIVTVISSVTSPTTSTTTAPTTTTTTSTPITGPLDDPQVLRLLLLGLGVLFVIVLVLYVRARRSK